MDKILQNNNVISFIMASDKDYSIKQIFDLVFKKHWEMKLIMKSQLLNLMQMIFLLSVGSKIKRTLTGHL